METTNIICECGSMYHSNNYCPKCGTTKQPNSEQETMIYIVNSSGRTIYAGEIVQIIGTTDNNKVLVVPTTSCELYKGALLAKTDIFTDTCGYVTMVS